MILFPVPVVSQREVMDLAGIVASRYFKYREDRQDAIQEFVLKALTIQRDYPDASRAFLSTAMHNKAQDILKSHRRHMRNVSLNSVVPGGDGATYQDALVDPAGWDFAERIAEREMIVDLLDAVDSRSPKAGRLMRERAVGITAERSAQNLGITGTTARSILSRAQISIRQHVAESMAVAA